MPPPDRYRILLLDLDGTLLDTAPEIADAVNEYLARRGLAPAAFDEVRGWIGFGARQLLRRALASRGVDGPAAADLDDFGRIYFAHCGRNSRPFPDVPEALRRLRAQGLRLAVISNKEARFAQASLAAHGLLEGIDLLVGGDTLPARKPDPLPVRHCLTWFGLPPAAALMVGDSDIDIETARAAGIAVWAVSYGYNGERQGFATAPDRIIDDFRTLPEMLGASNPLRSPAPAPSACA